MFSLSTCDCVRSWSSCVPSMSISRAVGDRGCGLLSRWSQVKQKRQWSDLCHDHRVDWYRVVSCTDYGHNYTSCMYCSVKMMKSMYLGTLHTRFHVYREAHHSYNKEKHCLVVFFSERVRLSTVTDAKFDVVFLHWLNHLSVMKQVVQAQVFRHGLPKGTIFIRQICFCWKSYLFLSCQIKKIS